MHDTEQVKRQICRFPPPGTLTGPRQRALLFDLARRCAEAGADVVEIGTGAGGTAIIMATALPPNVGTVWTYDPRPIDTAAHPAWSEAAQRFRLERCAANLCIYSAGSRIRAYDHGFGEVGEYPASIGLAFIDGDHREPAVRADVDAVLPQLKVGGWLAFHDTNLPGVAEVVEEFRWKRTDFKPFETISNLSVFERLS